MAKARTIREDQSVSGVIDSAIEKHPRLEDGWEAWKWRLSHDPETDAVQVPGHNPQVMLIKSDPLDSTYKMPMFTILYTFTEDEVNILAIKINEPA